MTDTTPDATGWWYVLVCLECHGDDPAGWIPMPFTTPAARGRWATAHTQGTGHERWIVEDQPRTGTDATTPAPAGTPPAGAFRGEVTRRREAALGRLLPELHPRWGGHVHRLTALGRINPDRWARVDADLDLVDQLEQRMTEMTWPVPRGGPDVPAAGPLRQLFRAARHDILSWHEMDQHRRPTAARDGDIGGGTSPPDDANATLHPDQPETDT